jgi:hypothetical protein
MDTKKDDDAPAQSRRSSWSAAIAQLPGFPEKAADVIPLPHGKQRSPYPDDPRREPDPPA